MEPLRIDLHLNSRMASPANPVHLDGLLAYIHVQQSLVIGEIDHDALISELPVEKYEDDDNWFYKASMFLPSAAVSHSSTFYTQRINEADMCNAIKAGDVSLKGNKDISDLSRHDIKIDSTRGALRNMLGFFPVTSCKQYTAYCIGDKEKIEDLLYSGYLTHFGPRRATGHGQIMGIDVSIDNEASDRWSIRYRHIRINESDIQSECTIKPPYWDKQTRLLGYVPVSV